MLFRINQFEQTINKQAILHPFKKLQKNCNLSVTKMV